MMSLSQTTGYAIQALTCLAEQEGAPMAVKDIAKTADIPAAYLAKIIRSLYLRKLVIAKRGFKGGVRLARDPAQITVLQISEAIDGQEYLCQCLLGGEFCTDERACPTHEFWKQTRGRIKDELAQKTLADVVAFHNSRRAKASKAKSRKR